ncbi:HaeIII family restriction endonuclease [Thorsellia anophelis]|uniref:HaeIII restriction endonuclease n=1 Tax=Thorsellia anophelis DSM 18579 TaxID=1123402 RepID=A0A1I0CEN6_9GAMM|nr:HaeIII family restriction endonuclease [Thorsellia anophelis]SET17570.1 HaeIII restriction endonuclease [Thorsellia anophelis DSM 18579]
MTKQLDNGKAFEWAVGHSLATFGLILIENDSSKENQMRFEKVSESQKALSLKNAGLAVNHIIKLEKISQGTFHFQSDTKGQEGDVRDIVINTDGREIGISCKNNHFAYKHSRLSDKADFIARWGLSEEGCSSAYFDKAKEIFGELREIKKKSSGKALWRDTNDVPGRFYWPTLDAFAAEIKRIETPEACANFIKYLVGTRDFYKVVSKPKHVEIIGFNINNTLKIKQLKLPSSIIDIRSKNGSQYAKTITFNLGWEFNFRIHNASSKIEPSLKFDITATALPPSLYQHHISHDI